MAEALQAEGRLMPRIRPRSSRKLSDDQRGWLMGHMYRLVGPADRALFCLSEAEAIAYLFGSEAGMKETWRAFRHQLIGECVDQNGPGTRPAAWWRYDAPGAPRTPPRSSPEERALLEEMGLIGVNERQRMAVTRPTRPDPDLEPVS